jgi:N4-(beta-N-acetylglucosaminyl)-L-asparaginase
VAALEGYVHPSRVAVAVMRYTDHVLLVGRGAARFAAEMGFERTDLLTERSREEWLEWRASLSDQDDYLTPGESGEPVTGFASPGGLQPAAADDAVGMLDSHDGVRPMGTIHCSAVDTAGDLSAVTTTSGLFFKVPGRVGDSPLPGCGCYCDNDVGAAGSTGRGEAVIKTVGAHLIVEEMRRGAHPTDACLTAVRRIVDWTVESRLLDEIGRPNFNVNYYALNKRGETGAAAIWSGQRHALNDGKDNRLVDSAYLFERA